SEIGGRFFQPRKRRGPEHAEPPRVGQVVVGRPACQLEELLEYLALDRLGLEALDRATRGDCLMNFHPSEGKASDAASGGDALRQEDALRREQLVVGIAANTIRPGVQELHLAHL